MQRLEFYRRQQPELPSHLREVGPPPPSPPIQAPQRVLPQEDLLCCCGAFSHVGFYATRDLSRHFFDIQTEGIEYAKRGGAWGVRLRQRHSQNHCAVVQVLPDTVALADSKSPYHVLLVDLVGKKKCARTLSCKFRSAAWSLMAMPESVAANARVVCAAQEDGRVLVFDGGTGRLLLCFERGCPQQIWAFERRIVSRFCKEDLFVGGSSIARYSLVTGRLIGGYKGSENAAVRALALHDPKQILVSASERKKLHIWSRDRFVRISETAGLSGPATCAYSTGNNEVLVGIRGGTIEVYDLRQLAAKVGEFPLCRRSASGSAIPGSQGRDWVHCIERVGADQFVSAFQNRIVKWSLSTQEIIDEAELPGKVYSVRQLQETNAELQLLEDKTEFLLVGFVAPSCVVRLFYAQIELHSFWSLMIEVAMDC